MPHDCLVSTRNLGVILMVERYESSRLYTDLPALPSLPASFHLSFLISLKPPPPAPREWQWVQLRDSGEATPQCVLKDPLSSAL